MKKSFTQKYEELMTKVNSIKFDQGEQYTSYIKRDFINYFVDRKGGKQNHEVTAVSQPLHIIRRMVSSDKTIPLIKEAIDLFYTLTEEEDAENNRRLEEQA